jgi:hypothetical protein
VLRASVLAAAATVIGTAHPAAAASRKLDLSASVRALASDNLFLVENGRATLMMEANGGADLTYQDERRSASASLVAGTRRYSREFDSEFFGRAQLSGTLRTSERLSLSASFRAARERLAEFEQEIASAVDPRRLSTSLDASFSASWRRSETSTLSPSFSIRRQSFEGGASLPGSAPLRSFTSIGTGLGFSRQLNERLSIGLAANGSADLFGGNDTGRSGQLSTSANASLALDEFTNLSGSLGVSRRIGGGGRFGGGSEGLGVTGSAGLCRRWLNQNGCVNAALSRQASGLGYAPRYTMGADYSWRIDRDTSIQASADYSRAEQFGRTFQFLSVNASGLRRVADGIAAGVTLGYRRRSSIVNASGAYAGINLSLTTDRNPS